MVATEKKSQFLKKKIKSDFFRQIEYIKVQLYSIEEKIILNWKLKSEQSHTKPINFFNYFEIFVNSE